MSNLLSQASLVMIPSGYKEDVVYSPVPTNGNGDLSFTRASNGTRINSAGLVEVCPWNLMDYSEAFVGGGWGTDGTSTATDNFTTAPNGTLTAAKVVANVASGYAYKGIAVSEGVYTFSLYVKASASTTIAISFDVGSVVKNVTTEWQRFEFSYSVTSGTKYVVYGGLNTGVNYFVWGAQLNIGSTAKPYFPTTDRLNVPRLTYQNGGGGCPSLLLEKQSTNLVLWSEQFDNAYWLNAGLTLSANSVVSPDGTQNADTATETSATSQHGLSSGLISFASGTTYTFSTFAKNAPSGRGFIQLYGYQLGAAAANVFANFDINTGVVGTLSGGTSTITNYGNGWYRCTFTFACGNSLSERINLFNVSSASATSGQSYVGDITKAIYWYGAQAEASSYPTSYINTTSATATRVADACFKTGISSLIGQTEGVLFVDINYLSHEAQSIFVIEDWVANSTVIRILSDTSTSLGAQVYVAASGGNQYTSTFNSAVVGQRYKCALAYKANDFAFYVNGTQVSTSSSGLVPTTSNVRFGAFISGQVMDGQINQAILFPTRLSNSELASLTTI